MNPMELAKKYYPRLWSRERIAALVAAGRLTQDQADRIMGAVFKVDTQGRG